MSTEDKKTDNELIAEFMGFDTWQHKTDGTIYRRWAPKGDEFEGTIIWDKNVKGLKYDKSWDWFMPVVMECRVKLDKLSSKTTKPQVEGIEIMDRVFDSLSWVAITAAHDNIVQFIRWYNTQPK